MATPHLSSEDVERFVTGRHESEGFDRVLRHLLEDCRRCKAELAPYLPLLFDEVEPAEPLRESAAYDEPVERAIHGFRARVPAYAREKERIPEILAAVLAAPTDRFGLPLIQNIRPRLRLSWALVEALLAASREVRFQHRLKMLHFAMMARVGAHNLSRQNYPAILLADLEARAYGELANAWRLNDDFDQAEREFSAADGLLDVGTGDPVVLGRLLDLQASLRTDQRRLPEALELLDHAERCYGDSGDRHLVGKALVKRGINRFYGGEPRAAVKLIGEGLTKLDPGRDTRLVATGQHNLLNALVECGELHQASEQLLRSGLHQAFAHEPVNLLHLRWVEGRIFAGQKKLRRAEAALQEVREGFYAQAMFYDAALVGLELAGVWLQLGKTAEVREVAEEARQTFEDLSVHVEACRAIRYFQEACRQDAATASLVQHILVFLRRLEWDPQLRFAV